MKNHSQLKNSKRKGFTLVELLVVIAIILVLGTLITLGVKAMRKKADAAAATQRLRGLATANTLYASDKNGKYVPAYAFDEDANAGLCWHYNPDFLQHASSFSFDVEDAEDFEGMDGMPEELLDPIAVKAKQKHWSRISGSFGYNDENAPGGGWGQPNTARSHTMASMKTPSETFAFITATDWITNYSGRLLWASQPVEGKTNNSKIAYRHSDKALAVFYDGHVEQISIDDMRNIDRNGGVNNVFWGGTRTGR